MPRYAAPDGKVVKGWVVRLEPTAEQAAQFRRDCGARRFAYNWAVTEISESFAAGKETGEYDPDVWSAYSLRRRWNTAKTEAAPWWAENSKESYANGIADAVAALRNWQDSRMGKRDGPAMRFPRRKKKNKDRPRCTYTTGALRVEGSRTIVLPKVGAVRTAENIRAIWRHVRRGSARLLSVTISGKADCWSVSLRLEIDAPRQPGLRTSTVGVDVGIGGNLLIVMRPDGTAVEKVPNPRALRASLADLRRANRALARKTEDSSRWRKAKRRLGRIQRRTAAIRKDTLHKATTRLAKTHSQVVIEDLAVRPLMRGLRSHRKSWTDTAAGELRRQLTYKATWYGCDLVVADRWYPSSKTCSACGHVNAELTMSDRKWDCPACGFHHGRDECAGTNLAKYPASQAEAQSDGKTGPARRVSVKRVNHPGKVA